ncbi:hypothetical protein KFL_000040120 [Klebsormidium nitens]|uniref:Helicase C-terminal domain-containing protein n=1 Tax=Klebsormidium nitens TaxID=105231 RepID=A0A1Y1HLF9_KLENI|nr:hypothetical protein KFL_000040120 [Klebsormidium nitens]|eukprot:GAQ77811.1 hypothetical protein KFL_000040120 [Klebsormidium nitens]
MSTNRCANIDSNDSFAGKENKRPFQDTLSQTEKKARVEKTGSGNFLGGSNDDCEVLTRQPGQQLFPLNENVDDDDDVVCYCFVCDRPQAECIKWGTGSQASDHCNAYDSWEWLLRRAAMGRSTGVEDSDYEEDDEEDDNMDDESLAPFEGLNCSTELHVALTIHPNETSARFGVVKIKVSLRRSSLEWDEKLKLGKVLAYLCKDTDPALQERVDELRQVKQAAGDIKSFADLLEKVQSNSVSEEEQPDGLAEGVTLRPYQKQSLCFMLDSERRGSGFRGLLWHKIPGAGTPAKDVFFCPALRLMKLEDKGKVWPATTGGFLCEVLALTVANPHPNPPPPPAGPPLSRGRRLPQIPDGGVPSKATLVVCAVSLVGQWINEAESKLKGPISMYKYHGSSRHTDPFFLAGHDIVREHLISFSTLFSHVYLTAVITTYGILEKDYGALTGQVVGSMFDGKRLSEEDKARLSPLHAINWWRVVLDESHTVKDPTVQQSRACAALKADRRWCCSGTPINTSISDLYGQFVFLGLDPLDDRQTFLDEISRPFERSLLLTGCNVFNKSKASLVFLLRKVMVRHTRTQTIAGEKLLVLPPKTQVDMPVHLSPEERTFYDTAAAGAKERFARYRLLGPEYISKHMLKIMALLLPLRRICNRGEIVLPSSSDGNIQEEDEGSRIAGLPKAPVPCSTNTPPDAEFCHECLTGALDSGPSQGRCPLCRQETAADDVIEGELPGTSTAVGPYLGADEGEGGTGIAPAIAPFLVESKLKALLEDLQKTRETDPTAKALIFSQFMGTIDWLKKRLTEAGVTYRYISGDMPLKKRPQAIEQFQQDPPTTVFLLSIRTGAVGITLTSASVVYLLEPVLNPAAVGRAWRMGQQRPVTVKRMFVADSVEEKILKVVKSRVEGGAAKPDSSADLELTAYRSKGKTIRPETIAGSIRFDKQNLRISGFELLFN